MEQRRMVHEGNSQKLVAKASGIDVDSEDKVAAAMAPFLEQMQALLAGLHAPKQVVRGADGRVVGVQTVQ
jgi:hypothetical protein